jgi:hypothetical protein
VAARRTPPSVGAPAGRSPRRGCRLQSAQRPGWWGSLRRAAQRRRRLRRSEEDGHQGSWWHGGAPHGHGKGCVLKKRIRKSRSDNYLALPMFNGLGYRVC